MSNILNQIKEDKLREEKPAEKQAESPEAKTVAGAEVKSGFLKSFFLMLSERCNFFHTPDHEPYVSIIHLTYIENLRTRSRRFRRFITRLFFEETGEPPSKADLNKILALCEAVALFDSEQHQVHIRVARHNDSIYIDLANDDYEQIEISAKGYQVISSKLSPVMFARTSRMASMCRPADGGSFLDLKALLNVSNENDWVLIVAWLIGTMRPDGPFPILLMQGEQGSAKSTTAKMLISLVDPSIIPLCTSPRSERDLFISASKARVLSYDNLSGIRDQLSDAFCRLATGGGMATRSLFTDDSEKLFNSKRPIIINGIAELLNRHDFGDRAIVINTAPIPKNQRRPEAEIWGKFEDLKPGILGALCNAASIALQNLDKVNLDDYPRMADFAQWVVAAEPALPWDKGSFLQEYNNNRSCVIELGLESDPVGSSILGLMSKTDEWSGSPTSLLVELNKNVPDHFRRLKTWPRQPNAMSNKLRRSATFLREKNLEIEWGKSGQRFISIRRVTDDKAPVPNVDHDETGTEFADFVVECECEEVA